MLLSDFEVLNRSFVQHPPVDLLVAAYMGYKSPESEENLNLQQASRKNKETIQSLPVIPTGGMKTIDQMPVYVRNPEMLAQIASLKERMAG